MLRRGDVDVVRESHRLAVHVRTTSETLRRLTDRSPRSASARIGARPSIEGHAQSGRPPVFANTWRPVRGLTAGCLPSPTPCRRVIDRLTATSSGPKILGLAGLVQRPL